MNEHHDTTHGSESREYCFVIMSYMPCYDPIYEQLRGLIESQTSLRCVRADRQPEPGRDLLGKVHEMILGASVVIADVSEHSPNVYYEYGYATAHDRRPILILREGSEPPTDLVGKESLRYRGVPSDDSRFSEQLIECINQQLRSPLPEQRRMLTGPRPFPAYLIAAPRVPAADSKHFWHPHERHTFGDLLGVTGILTAYGNLFGTRLLPEMLHAKYLAPGILANSANFFCIGSPKVNDATAYFLPLIQRGLSPSWEMPKIGSGADDRVVITGKAHLNDRLHAPIDERQECPVSDYGLIIRAPHPHDAQHIVLIVAGRHSIGTHAACMAVVRQDLIASLERHLKKAGVSLRDTCQPFWAIVRGTLLRDRSVAEEVEIIEAGGYTKTSRI
ncbi:MAG: hypothetical protein JNM18_21955 [Planctomycetaceae bacterium]|nr:hypothetical protein [Planctomycetaceae bacterium]